MFQARCFILVYNIKKKTKTEATSEEKHVFHVRTNLFLTDEIILIEIQVNAIVPYRFSIYPTQTFIKITRLILWAKSFSLIT